MATGRCVGDGRTGPARDIAIHILLCPEFARVYRDTPERALTPVEEYARWRREEQDDDRDVAREAKVAGTDAKRAELADRFRTRDILEDE
jgi:hypothetical protein